MALDPRQIQQLMAQASNRDYDLNPEMGALANKSPVIPPRSDLSMTPGFQGEMGGFTPPTPGGGIPLGGGGGLGGFGGGGFDPMAMQGGFGMAAGGGFDPMGMQGGAPGGFGGGLGGEMGGLTDLGAPSPGLGMTPSMDLGGLNTDIEMDTFAGLGNTPPIPQRHFGLGGNGKYNFSRSPQQFSNQRWGEPLYGAGPVKRFPAGESISSSFARYA